MRLKQRNSVDLPQPDGPMIAVTLRSGKPRSMFLSTCLVPYRKSGWRASAFNGGVAGGGDAMASPSSPGRGKSVGFDVTLASMVSPLDPLAQPVPQPDGHGVQPQRQQDQYDPGRRGV